MSKRDQHINLDQLRELVHYPYNCGKCMSEDICRGPVTGTYIHNCDGDEEVALAFGPTVRVNGRTYLVSDFVKMIEPSLFKEEE